MGVSMSTLAGWVVVLALFGGFGYREWSSSQRTQLASQPARSRLDRQAANAQKTVKKVKQPKESKPKQATQGSDAKPKAAKAPAPAPASAAAAAQAYYSSDDLAADRDRDAARNREFARQLSNAKQGTTFAKKTKEETRQKSVKQSRAEEVPVVAATAADADAGKVSAPSSTAGIDADDDSSSAATSPVLAATTQASAVDDMLEKSAPGPSVLRLTGTEEKPNYKPQKTKAPEVVETKKQRQNRKKAELAKAEREAAEADRKSKLEAQRRTARQAEGRAAKDGSAFMAAQAAKNNAWTEVGSNGKTASKGTNGLVPVQPLDTFDASAVQTDASKSSVPSYDKNEDWMSSLPSEEEQMEILRKDQNEDSWNTVTKKSKKAKKAEESAAPAAEVPAAAAPIAAKAAAAAPAPAVQKQRPAAVASQSSFAALAVENPEEELQEEEWDV
ncbi:hypothetical protein Sste5346_004638 [Sporothrix stenoceras]|uniref:Uncharacterized protein n=1 Tax=Sporothrix stenoceras TaxID=5173 RepID=A0ABR3Z7L4_9PEZI